MTTRYIRQSEIKLWKTCRRQWMLEYQQRRQAIPTAAKASDVGTLYHAGVQAHAEGHPNPVGVIEAMRDKYPDDPTFDKAFKLAKAMVEGYVDYLATSGDEADYENIAVEMVLEVPIGTIRGDDIVVTGRVDLLRRHIPTGLYYLRDYKTVSSFDQAGRQLQVDDQLQTYAALLLVQEGIEVVEAEWMMARKVLRTGSAKPPFYDTAKVRFNRTQLRHHWEHMTAALDEMVAAYQSLEADPSSHHRVAYPNPTKDCTWRCDFIDVCPMHDDGGDFIGALNNLYRLKESA